MKKYILSFLTETESETDYRTIATFDDIKEAKKVFREEVKTSHRGETTDYECKEYKTESVVLELYEGKDIDSLDFEETILQQVIYLEGIIDRMNYRGNYPIYYYSRATFNGKELMHTMYFQGEKQMWGKRHKVPQSEIHNWYHR